MGDKQLKLKFWGTRGSNPTAAQNMSTYGGETTCVELRTANNELIIFDMGTGIIRMGNSLINEENPVKDIHILLSHFHWDHIIGFASFKPVYIEGYNITIYAQKPEVGSLKEVFEDMLHNRYWPVPLEKMGAKIQFREVHPLIFKINEDIAVEARPHPHPGGALGYRILIDGKIVTFITDIEHPENELIKSVVDLSRNSDILIHEGHFSPEDLPLHREWGHSSWVEAVGVAKSSKSKRLIMTHHAPDYEDTQIAILESEARKSFPNSSFSRSEETIFLD